MYKTRAQRRVTHWGIIVIEMVFQFVGMDEVTHESRERRKKIEASGNTTILKECEGEGMAKEIRGKPGSVMCRSQECFKKEGGISHDEGC